MNRFLRIVLCLLMSVSFCACAKSDVPVESTPEVKEEVSPAPAAPVNKVESFYQSLVNEYGYVDMYNNETAQEAYSRYRTFAKRFLIEASKENDNEIVSPLSLYYAMAILANGAGNETRAQLENVLGMSTEDLNSFLKDLDSVHAGWGSEAAFRKVNALWFNTAKGLKLKEAFKETVAEYYGNGIGESDFTNASDLAQQVNYFASNCSYGTINDIVSAEDFSSDTSFLILNGLSTGERWAFPFDSSATALQTFHNYKGEDSVVEMMHQELWGHWQGNGYSGFEKRLDNAVDFVAVLPDEGVDIYDFINGMSDDIFHDLTDSYEEYSNVTEGGDYGCTADENITRLSFPKFSYEKEYDLKEVLSDMGLSDLFDYPTSDFSEMAEGDPDLVSALYLEKGKQKCTIEVNEERVVATAVTVLAGGLGAGGCQIRETIYHDLVFDRPFIYALMLGETPLFYGVVTKLGEPADQLIRIENITGKINIRDKASTKGEKLGTYQKGEIVYAYETVEAEGYTWYRIGENKWVADKNGEWIKVLDQ
ncbi:MAG: hypothetical protein K5648_07030 [Erysipelotrichaceae bacterium]|nr:hypothetical protein [Erysipelotrichaceae bacterium]